MPLVTQLCQLHHLATEALNGSGPGWAPVRATTWAGSVQDRKVSGRQRSLRKDAKRKRELKVPEDGGGVGDKERLRTTQRGLEVTISRNLFSSTDPSWQRQIGNPSHWPVITNNPKIRFWKETSYNGAHF